MAAKIQAIIGLVILSSFGQMPSGPGAELFESRSMAHSIPSSVMVMPLIKVKIEAG